MLGAPHYLLFALLLPAFASEQDVRQSMVNISRQLGVTCAYCHQMNNLKASDKEAFQTARAHLKMVTELNARRIRGLPKVDCYMCHQGHAKAPFKESLDPVKPADH